VAGQYRRDELEIDVRPLPCAPAPRFIVTPAVGLDPRERLIHLEGRPPIRYDTAAFDVGSTVAGLALPGCASMRWPRGPSAASWSMWRPSSRVRASAGAAAWWRWGRGAGGVELAFAFRARLEREGVRDASVLLLESGSRVLPGYPAGATRRVEANARARGIEIRLGAKVAEARATELVLADGERIPFDELAWVAGAASLPLFHGAGVALDERGFVRVRRTLQLLAHEDIFAVGDCASLEGAADLAKAGVYAVRQGPCSPPISARVSWGSRWSPIGPSVISSRCSTWATAAPSAASGA
jgi:selenide,water dikinase